MKDLSRLPRRNEAQVSRRCARVALTSCVLALAISLPSFGASPHQAIILTGDDLGGGLVVDHYPALGLPAVDSAGRVVVWLVVEGPGVTTANDGAVYEWANGSLARICREGDPFPPLGAGVSWGCAGGAMAPPQRLFGTTHFSGDGVDTGNDSGYVLVNGFVPTLVAREGSEAPQAGGLLYRYFGGYPQRVSSSGTVLFDAQVGEPGEGFQGLWGGAPNSPTLVARSGAPAPDMGGDFESLFTSVLNPSGLYAFHAGVVGGGQGIWFGQGGGAPTLLRGTGGSDPAGGGFFATFDSPTISRTGQIAFEAELSNGAEGIWAGGTGGTALRRVALEGETPPGGGTFEYFRPPVMNGWGRVAFRAWVSRPAPLDDGWGMFLETDAGLVKVAQEGDSAPNLTATTFDSLNTHLIPNLYGQVAFLAMIEGPMGRVQSIWVRHIDGSLELVVRGGEQLEVEPGVFKTVMELALEEGGIDDGGQTSFNDDGELVYRARFTNDYTFGAFYSQPEATGHSIFADGFNSGDVTNWSASEP